MLEGVERRDHQSQVLREVQEWKRQLEKDILAVCIDFEKRSGLTIDGLEVQRIPVQGYGGDETGSLIAGINTHIAL